jgi:ParB family chromosome partitioning protein
MAEFRTVALADIIVPERLRMVEEDHALAISASIVEHGLINPITLRKTPPATKPFKPYTLVAGAHRLRAVELLDDTEIDAMIVEGDRADGQLVEITENLFRNELSALDRAMFVMSYREIWEAKYGKVRPGNRANIAQLMEDEAASGFSKHVADRLGLSRRSVVYAQQIAKTLSPDLRRVLRGTPVADNQSQLLKLAAMEPERQRKIAVAFAEEPDIGRALDLTDLYAKSKADLPASIKRRGTILSNFDALSEKDRRETLRILIRDFPDDFAFALANPLSREPSDEA